MGDRRGVGALFVALVIFLGVQASYAAPVELRFWWNEQPAFVEVMQSIIEEFNTANPEIKVTLEPVADWRAKLAVAVAGGAGPDVAIIFSGDVQSFAASGILLPLNRYLDASYTDGLHPAHQALITHQGNQVALPLTLTTIALVYNEDVFAESGLAAPPDSTDSMWTWDEFSEVARLLTIHLTGGNSEVQAAGAALGSSDFWRLPWFYQAGATLLNESQTQAAINSAEALDALEYLHDLYARGFVKSDQNPLSLSQRQVGMAIMGHWDVSRIYDADSDANLGATFLPYGAQPAVGLGGDFVAALSYTEHPMEAVKFVKFLTSPEVTSRYGALRNYISPWRGVSPDYSPQIRALMPIYEQQALFASPKLVVDRGHPQYGQMVSVFQSEFNEAVNGNKTPIEALAAMETGINAALAR